MGNYFRPNAPFTGGTVSGDTYFLGNLSAGTYYSANTPLDVIIDNIASKYSGVTGDFLSLSGGTVTGDTNFSGNLSGGTIFSGSTNLYEIFSTTGDTNNLQIEIDSLSSSLSSYTQVSTFNSYTALTQSQLNTKANLSGATFTGQVNASSLSATTLSGETIFSGSTDLSNIFATQTSVNNIQNSLSAYTTNIQFTGYTASTNSVLNNQQEQINHKLDYSGGTVTGDTNFSGNLSGGTIFSGSTDLYNIFSTYDYYTTGSTFDNNTKLATFNRNDGQSYQLNLSALSTVDTFVTGFTYDNVNKITIKQNQGQSDLSVNVDNLEITNLKVSGTSTLNELNASSLSATTLSGGTLFSGSTPLSIIIQNIASQYSGGTVTSVGLSMPSAFTVSNSPITSNGTIAVTGAGLVSQYVRGDGTLANFPTAGGGGSSLSYYLNGSVSQMATFSHS